MSDVGEELPGESAAVERAFGVVNRRRILQGYFDTAGIVTPEDAWQHIYRLLLWINPTISLAHCYESDKCQPHKAWYPRSLAFHSWIAGQFGTAPTDLREEIDILFRRALPTLARVETETRQSAAVKHLARYRDQEMPLPGDDPDLVDIILGTLEQELIPDGIDNERARELVERVYTHFARENKRKNLLGRGFEDTLAAVIEQLPGYEMWEVRTRIPLGDIPGFTAVGEAGRRAEADLAMWEKRPGGRRIMVSAKWSTRADRERQFESDFDDYGKASAGGLFDYVLITNEFDAARIDAACKKVRGNQYLFTDVVHVQPDGVLVAYGKDAQLPDVKPGSKATAKPGRKRPKAHQLRTHINNGRLISLSAWLSKVLQ
jgi:hypothetical protein